MNRALVMETERPCRTIANRLAAHGLAVRGGFIPTVEDGVPALPDGRPTGAVLLVGAVGGSIWSAFRASPEVADGRCHPLDRWSARVIGAVARTLGVVPVFPFTGPPWWPFQRWACRAEPVAPSPLGLLIHPDYGLWHAYRGALLFPTPPADLPVPPTLPAHALPARSDQPVPARPPSDTDRVTGDRVTDGSGVSHPATSPCATCAEKPCLTRCPVGAFSDTGYDAAACLSYLGSESGRDCMQAGCLARRACLVGLDYRYADAHTAFHMRGFIAFVESG